MEIAIASIADIQELTRVEIESKIQFFVVNESHAIDYDSRLYRWQTYFNGQSPATSKPERVVFKAVIDNRIIGYIAGHLTTRYNKDAEIQSFYMLKDEQRKGGGSKLLKHFSDWLISHQAHSLCVGFEPENPYRAFYLKHGGQYLNPHWIYWDDVELLRTRISKKSTEF